MHTFTPNKTTDHRHLMRVAKSDSIQAEVIADLQAKMAEIQEEIDVLLPLTQDSNTPAEIKRIRDTIRPLRVKLVPYANLLSAMTRSNYNTQVIPGDPTTLDKALEYLKR